MSHRQTELWGENMSLVVDYVLQQDIQFAAAHFLSYL